MPPIGSTHGVKPQLRNQTSEDIAALFIAIEAQAGMAVLTEGVLPMLPSTLTVVSFSPELAPLLIAAGTPTLRPNPHSEAFLKILLEEINPPVAKEAMLSVSTKGPRRRQSAG